MYIELALMDGENEIDRVTVMTDATPKDFEAMVSLANAGATDEKVSDLTGWQLQN